jgi:hypothetical protein
LQWKERNGSSIILQNLHPLQGISFIIINGVYFNFILESLNVISLSKIPFLFISIVPGSCFAFTNNRKEEMHKREKTALNVDENE